MEKIFDNYVSAFNEILDKKLQNINESVSYRASSFSNIIEKSIGTENNQLPATPSQLQKLFGVAKGYRKNVSIGNHTDFIYIGKSGKEYHHCVSMFIDIKGSTNLALKYSLDEVRLMKDLVLSLCIKTATTFGGHIQRLQGDGLFIQFVGKDIYKNDSLINSLNTASVLCHFVSTDLSQILSQKDLEPLRIKIGIDYGGDDKVLWSYYGIPGCNELTTTSIHTDLAAKLQASANSNEIRIGDNIKEELDLPNEYLKVAKDKNNNDVPYIKSSINYKQYVFDWKAYLNDFDFFKRSTDGTNLELIEPIYSIKCYYSIDGEDLPYSQNLYSIDKDLKLTYCLYKNNIKYNKTNEDTITWKIHNCGREVPKDQLNFEVKEFKNKTVMNAYSKYLGHHWVECIIENKFRIDNIKVRFGVFIR